MRALDRKLLRDLRRLGLQVLALVLMMAAGAAVLIIGSAVELRIKDAALLDNEGMQEPATGLMARSRRAASPPSTA